jgi:hypothetical protein
VELYLYSPHTFSWRGAWLSTGTTLRIPAALRYITMLSHLACFSFTHPPQKSLCTCHFKLGITGVPTVSIGVCVVCKLRNNNISC